MDMDLKVGYGGDEFMRLLFDALKSGAEQLFRWRFQMKNEKTPDRGGIKKEMTLLFVFIALVIGFVGGVVFSAYKMNPETASEPAPPHNHADDAQIAALQETVSKDPKNVTAWIELGNLFFDAQKMDDAINAYESALKLEPDNANVLTDLGVMYRKKGQPKEALALFNRAQAINPKHEVSLFNAGIVLMHDLNQPKEAKAVWEKLIQLNPSAKTPGGESVKELIEKMK
jgi:cytochrome c-type biogenesis protein CcmH/NrfG